MRLNLSKVDNDIADGNCDTIVNIRMTYGLDEFC